MTGDVSFPAHNPEDPDPWLALYLDNSTPMDDRAKRAWLANERSVCRQFLLPLVRPLAWAAIMALQLVKTIFPRALTSSRLLHRCLYWGLSRFVKPEGNWLILRHFHIGSEILDFIARNVPGADIPLRPLKPRNLRDVADNMFLQHDINLFNFVINLQTAMAKKGLQIKKQEPPDFSGVSEEFQIEDMPRRWTNFVDLQTALAIFTPIYYLLLPENDFWRAANSLQLDETIGIYAATILGAPQQLVLVNNKHPLVPLPTLGTGFRLVLHGLATEMLHALLLKQKAAGAVEKTGGPGQVVSKPLARA